ncbi:MAG: ribbon-helix-helix domain-containing protein [Nanoarchaeota archaeon]|nr:ribbon-helix-helix domain-containing protein [Nanoarchaeota archaeon]
MENISLRLETKFLKELENLIKKHNYMTKTEFIREAIRDKIIELEKQETLKKLDNLFGSSKHKTTDEQLHAAGEKAFEQLEKKFKGKVK